MPTVTGNKSVYELPVLSPDYETLAAAMPPGGPVGLTDLKSLLLAGLILPSKLTTSAGDSITIKASDGLTSGAGGSIILQPGAQVTTGGDGVSVIKQTAASSAANFAEIKDSSNTILSRINSVGGLAVGSASYTLSANQNDLVLGNSSYHKINCTSASQITGIAPATGTSHPDGREIRLYNTGTQNITFKHNSGSSTSANRLYTFSVAPSRSLYLNGSQYRSVTNNATLKPNGAPYFICGWVYPLTTSAMRGLVCKYNSSGTEYEFQIWALDTNRLAIYSSGPNLTSTGTVTQNAWNFFFVYHDQFNLIKGIAKNNDAFATTTMSTTTGSNADFTIGTNYSNYVGTGTLNGYMEGLCYGKCNNDGWLGANVTNLRNYLYNNGAGITAAEFRSSVYYNNCVSASYWNLDEVSGNNYDSIGTNHFTNGSGSFGPGLIQNTGIDTVVQPGEFIDLVYDNTDNGSGAAGWRMM